MTQRSRFQFFSMLLFLLAPGCFPRAQSARPTAETCSISGIVVRKTDGGPLKGAVVQLVNDADKQHSIAAKTTADGHFDLRNLPAGQYRLKVTRNGFVDQEYGQKNPGDPGATFTLREGQNWSDLIFKLGRPAVITGRIYDDDGEPMPKVFVTALREGYKDGKKQLKIAGVDRSNDLGQFRLYDLPPGHYYVSAQNQEWGPQAGDAEFSAPNKTETELGYTKVYYPNTIDPSKALRVSVNEGDEIPSIDILMREVAVYRIRGRVVNLVSAHKGVETVLEVMRRGQNVEWDFAGGRSVTKPDGTFEISEIVPGEYTITAFFYDDGKGYSTQEDVNVVNADITGLMLTFAPGVNIPGKISWEGKPSVEAEGVQVAAAPLQSGTLWGGAVHVEANDQFTLKEVPQGTFRLEVSGIGKDCYVQEMRQGENVLTNSVFRVTRGSAPGLEIIVNCRGARVEGTVLNNDSLPVAGVWVAAIPEEGKRTQHTLFRSVTTDQYGHFELRGLAPGTYELFSWDGIERGAWEDEEFLKPFEGKGLSAEVKDGDARSLELKLIQAKDSGSKNE